VLKHKYVELYRTGATLPLDLDLGARFTYHSTFTCPISKELASSDNPPSLLPCTRALDPTATRPPRSALLTTP
jgi:hypothetical protein